MAEITQKKPEAPKPKLLQTAQPAPEIYADGVTGLLTSHGVVKLDLYSTAGFEAETKAELRRVCYRLVMPLAAINELGRLLQGLNQAAQQVQQARQTQAKSTATVRVARGGDSEKLDSPV